jgi:hypothetical protein
LAKIELDKIDKELLHEALYDILFEYSELVFENDVEEIDESNDEIGRIVALLREVAEPGTYIFPSKDKSSVIVVWVRQFEKTKRYPAKLKIRVAEIPIEELIAKYEEFWMAKYECKTGDYEEIVLTPEEYCNIFPECCPDFNEDPDYEDIEDRLLDEAEEEEERVAEEAVAEEEEEEWEEEDWD